MIRWFVPIIAFEQHIDNSVNFITFKQENGCGCHLLGIRCEKQEKNHLRKSFSHFSSAQIFRLFLLCGSYKPRRRPTTRNRECCLLFDAELSFHGPHKHFQEIPLFPNQHTHFYKILYCHRSGSAQQKNCIT